MSTKSLQNKVAVVTGGSSGIGKAIAIRFAKEGAIVVVSSRNKTRCDEVVQEISAAGSDSAVAIKCDVTDEREVIDLFHETITRFGQVDIVVANAGISGGNTTVDEYELSDWERVFKTNVTGVFLSVREAFRHMKKKGGTILVMSSQAGVEGYARKGPYCATKFAVRGLARALAEEGRQFGISVSSICPGTVDTPILAASNTQVRNPMSVEALADTATYLAKLGGNAIVRDVVIERMLHG